MPANKGGRPSKGARTRVEIRLPDQLVDAAEKRRLRLGKTMTDYIADLLAQDVAMAYEVQGRLDLSA